MAIKNCPQTLCHISDGLKANMDPLSGLDSCRAGPALRVCISTRTKYCKLSIQDNTRQISLTSPEC